MALHFIFQLSLIIYQEAISQLAHKSRLHQNFPSNNALSPFLTQVPFLLKSSDSLASFIALMALSSIFVKDLAYAMVLFKRFSEIDG